MRSTSPHILPTLYHIILKHVIISGKGIISMFGLFKKKEKLPLIVSGEYNGSYEPIQQKILSAQLSFDHDGVTFVADKGIKKDILHTFQWSEIDGFDFNSTKDNKNIVLDIALYLKDGRFDIQKVIPESDIQYAAERANILHYRKIQKFIANKLSPEVVE